MKKCENNRLAEGEVTGHYHDAIGDGVAVFGEEGPEVLRAPFGATVEHQEHRAVTLPPEDYDVSRVLEYDHAEEEARRVED